MTQRRELPIYQVDAFTSELFHGNPAAVCPLEEWLPEETMQAIAAENNLSETAFFFPLDESFEIRWFTPKVEVDLCGHATLATAWVLWNEMRFARGELVFHSAKNDELRVTCDGDLIALNFPSCPLHPHPPDAAVADALGAAPAELHFSDQLLAVFESEADVRGLAPDFDALARLDDSVIITAPGDEVDFVSRYFAPTLGIPEDPVTGAAHCTLVPYWSRRLDKTELHALQVSKRGGELWCSDRGDRVGIAGRAVCYLRGTISL